MKNRNCTVLALALVALAVTSTRTFAQSIYTPYLFATFADNEVSDASFRLPMGVAVDIAGSVYVANTHNHRIEKITPGGGVTTLAGGDGGYMDYGYVDGPGDEARFNLPMDVAVDLAGNAYVADYRNNAIRKITPAGEVTTLATFDASTGVGVYHPTSVAVDYAGNVYATRGDAILKIAPTGELTTLAGGNGFGSTDGPGNVAQFWGAAGVAADSAGSVYVADSYNQTIRKITPAGDVSTLAGSAELGEQGVGQIGYADGTGSAARFNFPSGMAVDRVGNVYVGDTGNNAIRKITPAGDVTTLGGPDDGSDSWVVFNGPKGVAVDYAGNVYVADMWNERIVKGTPMTVADTTPPVIVGPADIAVPSSVDLLVPVTFPVTATDDSDPSPTVTCSPPSGSFFLIGQTAVNCTATDANGNQSFCAFTITRSPLDFAGFAAPIGGADATGGSFASPIRAFKMNSTIPVKFTASSGDSPTTTGVHRLQVAKYSNETTADTPIDATPQDAATTGNQFRLASGQWYFNLDTKGTGMSIGIWQLIAVLSDGSQHAVWIQVK